MNGPAGVADIIRAALRCYDPLQPPETTAHRPLTAYEGKLPRWLPEPHGPDPVVFGPRRDDEPPEEGGVITRTCAAHDVEWAGYGVTCWCCEAGMKPC